MRLERRSVQRVMLIMTDHAVARMKERMPVSFALPAPETYIRLLTMRDTFHQKDLAVLRLRGGMVIGKQTSEKLVIVTMFAEDTFHRFQQRQKSRFIPLDTACYQIATIIGPNMA